jgi:hypothetical protein
MGGPEVEAFLTHLAVDRNVSSSTQSIAVNAANVLSVASSGHLLKKPSASYNTFY